MRIMGSTFYQLANCFFVIVLVGCANVPIVHSRSQSIPKNAWSCFSTDVSQSPIARYSSLLTCIDSQTPEASAPFDEHHHFNQALSTALSFVGREAEAIATFDRDLNTDIEVKADLTQTQPVPATNLKKIRTVPAIDLMQIQAIPATDFIVERAKKSQVVMINEAHHMPQTRALTIQLLKPLFDQGYRYLAAESFSSVGIAEANQKKYPDQTSGFYTAEPVFGEMIREAKRIGFHLVAYEHEDQCDYTKDPNRCQDQREKGQSQNLIDRILKKDPSAKFIVHAGYGHISEMGSFDTFRWKPMALYFSELSGINPLTIDQVTFVEHGKRELEDPIYRSLLKKFKPSRPVALVNQMREPWADPALSGQYDIQILLPPVREILGRPSWRTLLGWKRVTVHLPKACQTADCFVEGVRTVEERGQYVPSDLILVNRASVSNLILSHGRYRITVYDNKGQRLSTLSLTVNF